MALGRLGRRVLTVGLGAVTLAGGFSVGLQLAQADAGPSATSASATSAQVPEELKALVGHTKLSAARTAIEREEHSVPLSACPQVWEFLSQPDVQSFYAASFGTAPRETDRFAIGCPTLEKVTADYEASAELVASGALAASEG